MTIEKKVNGDTAELYLDGWLDAQIQFANGKDELQKAADELAEWEGYQALCNQFLLYFYLLYVTYMNQIAFFLIYQNLQFLFEFYHL